MWRLQLSTSPPEAMQLPATAYLGLGGNVGDVLLSMSRMLRMLDAHDCVAVEQVSPVYKTPPWGIEDQAWFLNCCVEVSSGLDPRSLLELCLAGERELHRTRSVRWGPRTIDADILTFGDYEVDHDQLTIPHPRMHERLFVMQPLADIAPDLMVRGRPTKDWAASLGDQDLETVALDEGWYRKGVTG